MKNKTLDEISIRRYIKKVVAYGVPKMLAREIVETSVIASKGGNTELYIKYAINLIYGLEVSRKSKRSV